MSEDFSNRLKSAAIAGWWTLLIATAFLAIQWGVYLILMYCGRPDWMLRFWGGQDQWPEIQHVWLWMMAAFKMSIWIMAMPVVWISLWSRRMRKTRF